MPGGRPSIKKETVTKLEEAFSIGADVTAACAYANISRKTYYEWIKDDEKLSDRFASLREKPVLKAYQTIAKSLDNASDAQWYLERKRKKEFSKRIEQTGKDGKDLYPKPILDVHEDNSDKEGNGNEAKD